MWYSELIATSDLENHVPWNRATRKDYKRDGGRYESGVTDKEWAIIEPMIPKQALGRPRQDLRDFNAIEYVKLATGCQWRALPRHFRISPHSTAMKYFYRRVDGSLPSSGKGCGADPGKFSGLGEAGWMPLHDATGRSASEPAAFCEYRLRADQRARLNT